MKKRYYKATPQFEEATPQLAVLLNCLEEDVVCLYDAQDDEGEWLEELYDETEIGLPKREPEAFTLDLPDNGTMSYWEIKIPGINKAYISQDAGPFGIFLNKNDVGELHFENF